MAGGQKTVTLVTSQPGTTIPSSGPEASLPSLTSQQQQPSTSPMETGDGPVTSDAALAALAAEAGLILPPGAEEEETGEKEGENASTDAEENGVDDGSETTKKNELKTSQPNAMEAQEETMVEGGESAQNHCEKESNSLEGVLDSCLKDTPGKSCLDSVNDSTMDGIIESAKIKEDNSEEANGPPAEERRSQNGLDAQDPLSANVETKNELLDSDDMNVCKEPGTKGNADADSGDPLSTLASAAINSSFSTTTAIKSESTVLTNSSEMVS